VVSVATGCSLETYDAKCSADPLKRRDGGTAVLLEVGVDISGMVDGESVETNRLAVFNAATDGGSIFERSVSIAI
jgi:hypothetical protein